MRANLIRQSGKLTYSVDILPKIMHKTDLYMKNSAYDTVPEDVRRHVYDTIP